MFSPNYAIKLQKESTTVGMATRRFAVSCEKCCLSGYHMDCDKCPVEKAHLDQVEMIISLRQADKMKRQKKIEEVKNKLDECIKMIEDIYKTIYCPAQLDEHNNKLDELTDEWLKMKDGEDNA